MLSKWGCVGVLQIDGVPTALECARSLRGSGWALGCRVAPSDLVEEARRGFKRWKVILHYAFETCDLTSVTTYIKSTPAGPKFGSFLRFLILTFGQLYCTARY